MGICHQSFKLIKETSIPSLKIQYQEFQHIKTGAKHIHLASDNDENAFMVSLRTVPQDSKGVAHILEHTALCGSKNFPLKDPFMSMTSRSLNTFMNAMTSSDWTAYPFASQNKKDFDNLLSVYLDAVFFANLDPLAFAQEGHRLEYAEPTNANSALTFKGVVFNEMKGALSADPALLREAVYKVLYPTVTYHHNSGGNPSNITDLTYDELKEFYRVHYHPSNAVFFTYGNITAQEHQQRFDELALSQFEKLDTKIEVKKEQRYTTPQYAEESYPIAEDASTEKKCYTTINWLLGESTDLLQATKTQLIVQLLFGNSASPLRKSLESSGLGTSIAPISGLNSYAREMSFTCGLSGTNLDTARDIEQLVLNVLNDIAENGLPQEMIEACLHQFELSQRNVSAGSMPVGLNLAMSSLNSATHYGDAADPFNLDDILIELQEKVKNPNYIKNLVKEIFIDNQHRVLHVLTPSTTLAAEKQQQEKKKLVNIEASLTEQDKIQIIETYQQLQKRQNLKEDKDILPKVTVADIPKEVSYPTVFSVQQESIKLSQYSAGTNGLVYQHIIMPITELTDDELKYIPFYTNLLPSLGMGDSNYLDVQLLKSNILGRFSVNFSVAADKSDANCLHGNIIFSAFGLSSKQEEITHFLQDAIDNARFDESQRIRELISMMKTNIEMSISQIGQKLAMQAAASSLSSFGYLSHAQSNLESVRLMKALEKEIESEEGMAVFIKRLEAIHQKIKQLPRQAIVVGEENQLANYAEVIQRNLSLVESSDENVFEVAPDFVDEDIAYVMNTQVNFCARAYPTVPMVHPDAAKLSVLGVILKNNYLHQAIRENGGAYGGGAMQDNQSAVFKFFSYRDPRLTETFNDFENSIHWVTNNEITDLMLEEAILAIVSQIDTPLSPSDEARAAFINELNNLSASAKSTFRSQLLSVSGQDVKAVASKYLNKTNARNAVITNAENAKGLGFKTYQI